jgi:hypothetical protein
MGRFYDGDIEGKFWFGIQSSSDIENLVTIAPCMYYSWKICNCTAEIDCQEYCKDCYDSKEDHIISVTENDQYDDETLYYEEQCCGYSLNKETHYLELQDNMNKLRTEISEEIIKEFDKLTRNDNILNAFTGVFDNTHKSINNIENKEERQKVAVLVARYTLGYQIEYCLLKRGDCNVNCDF